MKGIISYLHSIKKTHIILFLIILFDLLLYTCVAHDKEMHFCDEMWSYASANSPVQPFLVQGSPYFNKWKSRDEVKNLFSPSLKDRFTYSRILNNLDIDVHAPVYHYIIHTISSIFNGTDSIWVGLSINYISFIIVMIFLFQSVKLLNSERTALIICLMFSLSVGAIIQATFIRMYELLCAFSMACIYFHIVLLKSIYCDEHLDNKQINKILFIISGLYLLAYLTHFSFIVFAGLLSFCSFMLICKKTNDISLCGKYVLCTTAPFILSFIILPKSFNILMGKVYADGGRILNRLVNEDLLFRFHQFWQILDHKLHLTYLFCAGIISALIFIWKKTIKFKFIPVDNSTSFTYNFKLSFKRFKITIPKHNVLFFLLFSFIFITTFLLIIKTSYFPNIRYVWMIVPIIYLLLGLLINSKYSITLFLVAAILAASINIRDEKIDFLTKIHKSKIWLNENKIETILYYKRLSWLHYIEDSSLLSSVPRSYATSDLTKHIDTSSDKVAVIFSSQLFNPGSRDLPLEYVDTTKKALGFNEAKQLSKEQGGELWLFSKSDKSNTTGTH